MFLNQKRASGQRAGAAWQAWGGPLGLFKTLTRTLHCTTVREKLEFQGSPQGPWGEFLGSGVHKRGPGAFLDEFCRQRPGAIVFIKILQVLLAHSHIPGIPRRTKLPQNQRA